MGKFNYLVAFQYLRSNDKIELIFQLFADRALMMLGQRNCCILPAWSKDLLIPVINLLTKQGWIRDPEEQIFWIDCRSGEVIEDGITDLGMIQLQAAVNQAQRGFVYSANVKLSNMLREMGLNIPITLSDQEAYIDKCSLYQPIPSFSDYGRDQHHVDLSHLVTDDLVRVPKGYLCYRHWGSQALVQTARHLMAENTVGWEGIVMQSGGGAGSDDTFTTVTEQLLLDFPWESGNTVKICLKLPILSDGAGCERVPSLAALTASSLERLIPHMCGQKLEVNQAGEKMWSGNSFPAEGVCSFSYRDASSMVAELLRQSGYGFYMGADFFVIDCTAAHLTMGKPVLPIQGEALVMNDLNMRIPNSLFILLFLQMHGIQLPFYESFHAPEYICREAFIGLVDEQDLLVPGSRPEAAILYLNGWKESHHNIVVVVGTCKAAVKEMEAKYELRMNARERVYVRV